MIACTEKGSAVRLFPTRHGREIAARPGGHTTGCPLGSPSPSPPRREPRPGEVVSAGLAGWGVSDQSCAPPSHRAHAFAGEPGLLGRRGRQAGSFLVATTTSRSLDQYVPTLALLHRPLRLWEEKGRGDHFGAGSETTQVHCVGKVHVGHRVLRTYVRASSDAIAARVARGARRITGRRRARASCEALAFDSVVHWWGGNLAMEACNCASNLGISCPS